MHNANPDYRNLSIGDNVHMGPLVVLDLAQRLVVEDDATVSMGATILTHADVGDRPLADIYPRAAEPARVGAGAYPVTSSSTLQRHCGAVVEPTPFLNTMPCEANDAGA